MSTTILQSSAKFCEKRLAQSFIHYWMSRLSGFTQPGKSKLFNVIFVSMNVLDNISLSLMKLRSRDQFCQIMVNFVLKYQICIVNYSKLIKWEWVLWKTANHSGYIFYKIPFKWWTALMMLALNCYISGAPDFFKLVKNAFQDRIASIVSSRERTIRRQFWYCVNIVLFSTKRVFCFKASM